MEMNCHAGIFCALVATLGVFGSGCSREKEISESQIRIEAIVPLEAKVGSDLEWSFRATRDGRSVKIVNYFASRLPFGVLPSTDPKFAGFRGKVLGRQFRTGIIKVTAFDTDGCEREYEMLKVVTMKNAVRTGNTNVSIPISPCDLKVPGALDQAERYVSHAFFTWTMVDGPDEVTPGQYRDQARSFFCGIRGDCPGAKITKTARVPGAGRKPRATKAPPAAEAFMANTMVIPVLESPHTVDVVLGNCAGTKRERCGFDPDCLWSGRACVSKKVTGRNPAMEVSP